MVYTESGKSIAQGQLTTLSDLIESRKDVPYDDFRFEFYRYPVEQLKRILRTELDENNVKHAISKLKKKEVIIALRGLKYDLTEEIQKTERKQEILKKYSTVKFSPDEQKEFIEHEYHDDNFDPLLARKEYFNKRTNNFETTVLQKHQNKFIRSFILANVSGSIVFHGVGTGKTLTAVVASHYYLSVYVNNNVIVISPPALIYNFLEGLQQYGINIRDNRYAYYTYEGFIRNYTKHDLTNSLLVIDEAHNFRTQIIAAEGENTETGNKTVHITSNKRGYHLLNAVKMCHKAICLTGTPFINDLYDIENLISMVDKKEPLKKNLFYSVTTDPPNRKDYFKYKISHYENDKDNDPNFPKVNLTIQPLVMNEEEVERYNGIVKADPITDEDYEFVPEKMLNDPAKANAFYNLPRQFSNNIEDLKIQFITDKIQETGFKTIIYTTFITNGIKQLRKYLSKNKITFGIISGKENKQQKEKARQDFNDDIIKVLIISKAGTEGVDTKGCRQIFIMEALWNEALTNQAIARAVRYKSHFHLPKNEQRVDVYRLILAKPTDVEVLNKINESLRKNKKLNYFKILEGFKKAEEKLKILQQDFMDEDGHVDKSKIKKLPKELRGEVYKTMDFNRYEVDNMVNEILNSIPSVDTRLLVMSLSKQQRIVNFIKELDNIPQLEDYQGNLEKIVDKAIADGVKPKQLLKLQQAELKKQRNNIIKSEGSLNDMMDKIEQSRLRSKEKLDKVKRYQEFFTPDKFVNILIKGSTKLSTEFSHLDVLEPSAGIGNIVVGILRKYANCHIDMVEIQPDNRKILQDTLVSASPDILTLKEQGDFLRYIPDKQYDLVIMNPPYHLQKRLISTLDRDYYDMDFVMKCFSMLKVDGEIIALVRYENTLKHEFKTWLDSLEDCKTTLYQGEKWKGEKADELSKIGSINLAVLKITKTENDEHTPLLVVETASQRKRADLAQQGWSLSATTKADSQRISSELENLRSLRRKLHNETKRLLNTWKNRKRNE